MDGKPENLEQLPAMTAEKDESQNLQEDGIVFDNTFGQSGMTVRYYIIDRQTDRQTDRRTDRQTDRQTDR